MEDELWRSVLVPARLITDRHVHQHGFLFYCHLLAAGGGRVQASWSRLGSLTGLGGRTQLRAATGELIARGWLKRTKPPGSRATEYQLDRPASRRGPGGLVVMPVSLIQHHVLTPGAKHLYARLLAHRLSGQAGFTGDSQELVRKMNVGGESLVRRRIRQLRESGWLRIDRTNQPWVRIYAALDPHLASREAAKAAAERRLAAAPYKGEAILREMLNVLVADDRCQDHDRPPELVNPVTGASLELDRHYRKASVAFEFNGHQHYQQTEHFPELELLQDQRYRDLEKHAQAKAAGIDLIDIVPEELRFDVLAEKIGDRLPLRELSRDDPVVAWLENESGDYIRRVGREYARIES